jgi:hypothetical protein
MRVSSFKVLSVCFLVLALVSPHPSAATPKVRSIFLEPVEVPCVGGTRTTVVFAESYPSPVPVGLFDDFMNHIKTEKWCASICDAVLCPMDQYSKESKDGAGTGYDLVQLLKSLGATFNTVHNTVNLPPMYLAWRSINERCVCEGKSEKSDIEEASDPVSLHQR